MLNVNFMHGKNREVIWVVKGDGKLGIILLFQTILAIFWFPDPTVLFCW